MKSEGTIQALKKIISDKQLLLDMVIEPYGARSLSEYLTSCIVQLHGNMKVLFKIRPILVAVAKESDQEESFSFIDISIKCSE